MLKFACGYVDWAQDAKEGGLDALVWFLQELGPSVVSDKVEEPTELQTLSLTVSRYSFLDSKIFPKFECNVTRLLAFTVFQVCNEKSMKETKFLGVKCTRV